MRVHDGLIESAEDLVHDVAKYMVFETRFVDVSAGGNDLRTALIADLCHTRKATNAKGETETEAAWQLWKRMLPDALKAHELAVEVSERMEQLANIAWDDPSTDWRRVAGLAKEASVGIRALLVNLRTAKGGESDG